MCSCWGWGACVSADNHRVQKRESDPLELVFQLDVSYSVWEMGKKLGSSARAVRVFLTAELPLQSILRIFFQ